MLYQVDEEVELDTGKCVGPVRRAADPAKVPDDLPGVAWRRCCSRRPAPPMAISGS
jgi:hypothetical protein